MTKIRSAILFGILAIMSLCYAGVAYASAAADEDKRIYDEAGLLTSSEHNDLEEMCLQYGADAGIGIYILTHDDPGAVDAEVYIEDFYDRGVYGDSVFLLIDLYNRDVVIEGYGTAQTYIHSKRGDVIREEITPYLSDGDYRTAFQIYIEESAAYMKDDSELNYDYDYSYDSEGNRVSGNSSTDPAKNILTNVWFQLLISLAIGGIVVGAMAYNSGGRMTAGGNTYMDPGHSGLIGRRDLYLRTTVTRVRRPQNNNTGRGGFNAGGFRGGISSGGSSHSTSRGKF
jgi:uncharacterized protein